jgi:hypothetical protein
MNPRSTTENPNELYPRHFSVPDKKTRKIMKINNFKN